MALFGKKRELKVEQAVDRLSETASDKQRDYVVFLADKLEELAERRKADAEAACKHDQTLEEGKRIFEETRTSAEEYAAQLARLQDLQAQGAIDADTSETAKEGAVNLTSVFQGFGQVTSSAFEDAIIRGEKLGKVLNSLLIGLKRLAIRGSMITISGSLNSTTAVGWTRWPTSG